MPMPFPALSASRARVRIIAGAALFSTGALAIKLCSLTPWQVASFRSAVAALALALMSSAARRALGLRALLAAVPYAATVILFTLANRATTAASTIFLQDTAPLYLLLLGPWVLREPVTRRDWWFIAAVATGLVLLVAGSPDAAATAPDPAFGNALAAAAGLTWALTLLALRWLATAPGGGDAALGGALAGNLLAALTAGAFAFPVGGSTPSDWLLITYLGVFQIALAYVLITAAMTRVSALEAALLLLVEPVLTPVWAWLVLGEGAGALAILGGAVIGGATLGRAWQTRAR